MLPTVITGLPATARCMQEEIFGPVVCIAPFDTEEEVRIYDTVLREVYISNSTLRHKAYKYTEQQKKLMIYLATLTKIHCTCIKINIWIQMSYSQPTPY